MVVGVDGGVGGVCVWVCGCVGVWVCGVWCVCVWGCVCGCVCVGVFVSVFANEHRHEWRGVRVDGRVGGIGVNSARVSAARPTLFWGAR